MTLPCPARKDADAPCVNKAARKRRAFAALRHAQFGFDLTYSGGYGPRLTG
jgi:hypothetical protein